ncbi:MAG TPA: hypothetical protein VGY98_12460 [Verrucomicrobiae bacterium]|nr:hypothetical protein [Verrucomicrobiae bacterium]
MISISVGDAHGYYGIALSARIAVCFKNLCPSVFICGFKTQFLPQLPQIIEWIADLLIKFI